MRIEKQRYADRGLRRAIRVTPDGLVEQFALGITRTTLWSQVRGVQWLRHGQAQVLRVKGRPSRLPADHDQLDEMVEAIEQTATETQADWREHGIPARLVCEWLGIELGGQWRYDPNPGTAVLGGFLAVIGPASLLLTMKMVSAGLVILVVGCGLLWAGLSRSYPVVTASSRGLRWQRRETAWQVAWPDVRRAEVSTTSGKNPVTTIQMFTSDGPIREVAGPAARFAPVVQVVEQAVAVNNARFDEAGDEPIPDTALSPARLAESPDAERGLSRAER